VVSPVDPLADYGVPAVQSRTAQSVDGALAAAALRWTVYLDTTGTPPAETA
jgi:hypothetical protein